MLNRKRQIGTEFIRFLLGLIGLLCFVSTLAFAQGSVVPLSSPAYRLLERAENLQLLSSNLPQHRPLTRGEVAFHLSQLDSAVRANSEANTDFSKVDREQLDGLLFEFSFEIKGDVPRSDQSRISQIRKVAFRWLPKPMYRNGDDLWDFQEDDFTVRINPRFRYDVGNSPNPEWNGLRRMGMGWSIQADWLRKFSVSFRYIDHYDPANSSSARHTLREWNRFGQGDILLAGESVSNITRNPVDSTYTKTSEEYLNSTTSIGYKAGKLHILAGRESVGWGPGIQHQLSLGQQVAPLDQIRLDFNLSRHFRSSSWIGPS